MTISQLRTKVCRKLKEKLGVVIKSSLKMMEMAHICVVDEEGQWYKTLMLDVKTINELVIDTSMQKQNKKKEMPRW